MNRFSFIIREAGEKFAGIGFARIEAGEKNYRNWFY